MAKNPVLDQKEDEVKHGAKEDRGQMSHIVTLILIGAYISLSACMISFNKYLMNAERFPFAVVLTMLHMLTGTCVTAVLYLLKPKLFSALQGPAWRAAQSNGSLWLKISSICFLFSGQLILTNTAYLKSSVPFLQMMKETNIVWIYLISTVASLEPFQIQRLLLIFLILLATGLTIHGEMHFSLSGFLIQGSSQLMEVSKLTLQGLVLRSAALKLDPLSYVLITNPICFALLSAAFLIITYSVNNPLLPVPQLVSFRWWPLLLANACVAAALNITIAFTFQRISPLQFILVGIVKDICIVMISVLLVGEEVSFIQLVGFALQLCLIFAWNYLFAGAKTKPASEAIDSKYESDAEASCASKLRGKDVNDDKVPMVTSPWSNNTDYGTTKPVSA